MEGFSPYIFKAYDIRGIYGTDFDAKFAQRLGSQLASYFSPGIFLLGQDGRNSSEPLAYAVADGALHAGAQVIRLGHVSTPQFQWALRAYGARGGVMVTASHNPGEYNGFKVIGSTEGIMGGDRLRQLWDAHEFTHRSGGTLEERDPIPEYAAAIAYLAQWSRGTVIRATLDVPPPVARAFGLLSPIAPDSACAVRCDTDGDRLALFAHGRHIAPEAITLALIEGYALQPIIGDLRFSRALSERLAIRNIPFIRNKVGRLHMIEGMQKHHARLGSELSGHYYWSDMANMESPELTFLRLYTVIDGDVGRLTSLASEHLRYIRSDEINLPVRDRKHGDAALQSVERHFQSCAFDYLDGITVDCWDRGFWFNVRSSNTEPVLRLIVEAKEKDLLDHQIAEVRKLIA